MIYKPLRTINPSDIDVTERSSAWLAARGLMPARGREGNCFPHHLIEDGAAMRTCPDSSLSKNGLVILNGNGDAAVSNAIGSLKWRGCWTIDERPVIGHCTAGGYLRAPFSSFNVGYRYRQGWKPKK